MARVAEIDLVGELFPIGLLRCKNALENMDPSDVLCICSDDASVVAHVLKLLRRGDHRVLERKEQEKDRLYRIHIQKV